MNTEKHKSASLIVDKLLNGMALDSIRVYSTIILCGFFRPNFPAELPVEAWVSISGEVQVKLAHENGIMPISEKNDFFQQRSTILSKLYLLLGKTVSFAHVSSLGMLEIEFDAIRICAYPDSESLEEIWAVMNDNPDANDNHHWYVSLDDSGKVSARSPHPDMK